MNRSLSQSLNQKLQSVKLLVMDVDGILTDGTLSFLADGTEVKTFSILDGLGLKLLMQSGVETAIITGRSSPQVELRAKSLGINFTQQGREDKLSALTELWHRTGYGPENTAYIGDDLPDLAAIRACVFGATVPNGHWFVREHADWITETMGGKGAVRELCDQIMLAQKTLEASLESYR